MIVGTSSGGDRDRSNEDNNNDRDIGSYNVDGSATKIVIMMPQWKIDVEREGRGCARDKFSLQWLREASFRFGSLIPSYSVSNRVTSGCVDAPHDEGEHD
ncbi:hypothetical protein JHK85_043033 [Glycine max]|nr:hypothetical protein JHK85_043033 [Glycine max]